MRIQLESCLCKFPWIKTEVYTSKVCLFILHKKESCSSVGSEEFEPDALVDCGVAHRHDNSEVKTGYILMAEPDHIIVKPIPNLSRDGCGAVFPFFYIEPQKYEFVLPKFFPKENGPITNIDPIGNSPVIVGKESLKKIAQTWMNVSLAMKRDPVADKDFYPSLICWYAYAVASALHNAGNILYKDFMIQGKLTYGKIGEWRFEKRSYTTAWPPKNLPLPPPGVPESVVCLHHIRIVTTLIST
ncbi:hypothetical protein HYC85_027872 [Camellia sinensis]|uniref:Hydroxyproline O-arabinosyltransferase-like domain-containing protein n=1 Tax=Camellia sinensis TaxID=4442 RepID=A0A7J7FUL9_CAMSI|nr:hypothetical protein HYC85_027872 [Camellia sinensis]